MPPDLIAWIRKRDYVLRLLIDDEGAVRTSETVELSARFMVAVQRLRI